MSNVYSFLNIYKKLNENFRFHPNFLKIKIKNVIYQGFNYYNLIILIAIPLIRKLKMKPWKN